MIETDWSRKYSDCIISNQTLDLYKKSPESFIDDLKMKYLKEYLPDSGIIVEVGAGSGRLLTRVGLENKNYRLIGFDYESLPVTLIKNNLEKFALNGTSMRANAFKIPIKSNSVNVVISGGLLEHFTSSELNIIIQEMHRILKPNGLLYADIVPGISSLCRPIILTKEYGGYENNFSKKQWKEILVFNGFTNAKVFRGLVIPPNFYGLFRSGYQLKLMYKIQPYLNKLDDTYIANMLGFMYYVFCRK